MSATPWLALPWAVHISDGVLTAPWLASGFALAGLLAVIAANRIRDDEIPRIALLSAAFFVASLMHLRFGPTSVHLLLNGLVGVVLGRRAPLAILIGLALQAALLGHGGFSTIGVNTCVLTLPALAAGGFFAVLRRFWQNHPHNPALLWLLGFGLGVTSVLMTIALQAVVLLWGGAERWDQIVAVVFLAHLPIAGLEGVVLGFTVRFLARVKPEMIGLSNFDLPNRLREQDEVAAQEDRIRPAASPLTDSVSTDSGILRSPAASRPPLLLLVVLSSLFAARTAHAHRLDAAFVVLPDRQVRIESWFDLGGVPKGASVKVFRPGQRLLVEGQLDGEGCFVFRFTEAEPLEVIVSTAGHRTSLVIPAEELAPSPTQTLTTDSSAPIAAGSTRVRPDGDGWRERLKEALIGVGFLLGLAGFLLSWRNARQLRSLRHSARDESSRHV